MGLGLLQRDCEANSAGDVLSAGPALALLAAAGLLGRIGDAAADVEDAGAFGREGLAGCDPVDTPFTALTDKRRGPRWTTRTPAREKRR